jgi:hypothetical protein
MQSSSAWAATTSDRRLASKSARTVGSAFHRAVVIVLKVLRNVAVGAALSSLFAVVFTHGNVLVPTREQSFVEFISANAVWFITLYSALMTLQLSITLMGETFTANAALSQQQKLLLCARKLLWRLSGHILLACTSTVLFVWYVSMQTPTYKLGMYFTGLSASYITICADVHARHISQTETERGRKRELARQEARRQKQEQAEQEAQDVDFTSHPLPVSPRRPHRRHRHHRGCQGSTRQRISLKYALRVALQDTPMVITSMLAIAYVHAITALLDITQQWQFVVFTVCSMLLKLGVQETMKAAMLKHLRTPPKRLVMALIATPTILIETQVRVYQLRLTSNTVKVLSIVTLALVEVAVRVVKLVAIQRQIGERIFSSTIRVVAIKTRRVSRVMSASKRVNYLGVRLRPPSLRTLVRLGNRDEIDRKSKLLMMHTAETYADMYAEYVALGCSYAMFVCFSEHPFFAFDAGSADTSYVQTSYWLILLLQVGIEVMVDTLACTCETLLGIRFEDFDQDDWFITTHMITMAFDNIGICAGLYVKV